MSLDLTAGAPVVLGGTNAAGYEATPELRYETTDKSGVRTVTAVLSRKIHCLSKHAEAIKQSAAFSGQIVFIGGKSYGAGWEVSGMSVVPAGGEWSVVRIEARREGVTPFEYELPPKLSMEMSAGVATLYYTKANGSKIQMLQWDSQTGEDRYGWKVVYTKVGTKHYAVLHVGRFSVDLFDVAVTYEGVMQFSLPFDGTRFSTPSGYVLENRTVVNSAYYPAEKTLVQEEAGAAEAAALATLAAEASRNAASPPMDVYGTSKYLVSVDEDNAVTTLVSGSYYASAWKRYSTTVPCVYAVYDVSDLTSTQNRGLYWEMVTDTDSGSPTHLHVFYRLRYGQTILFAIDVTSAESA